MYEKRKVFSFFTYRVFYSKHLFPLVIFTINNENTYTHIHVYVCIKRMGESERERETSSVSLCNCFAINKFKTNKSLQTFLNTIRAGAIIGSTQRGDCP